MNRRILVVIVADSVEQPQWILVPLSREFSELLDSLLRPEVRGTTGPAEQPPKDIQLRDWSGQLLPADIRIGEIPLPGVVFAVMPAREAGRALSRVADVSVWLYRQMLMRDQKSADRISRFLSSPDATVAASPAREIDVFVSYSFEDSSVAASIVRKLEARSLRVFLAESSLNTGRQWREQLRDAVRSSRAAILLITRSSVHSSWVLAEAGALAMQNTPMVVVLDGIQAHELPGPLRNAAATEPVTESQRWLDAVDSRVRSPDPKPEPACPA
jgi:hypothetical protein